MTGIGTGTLLLLWLIVAVEFVSPIPGALTIGGAWVLLTRPRWFLTLVLRLYNIIP
jgi:hypothetical protein